MASATTLFGSNREGDPSARGYAASGDQGSGQGSKQGGSPIDDPCPDPLRGIYGERYYPIRVQSRGRPFGKGHLWPPGTASLARPRPSILWLFNECFGAATVRVVENTAMGTVPILKSGRGKLLCFAQGKVILAASTFRR
jgi:hypothetical protein